MPQCQDNSRIACAECTSDLAEIAKQLKIANQLKAIELSLEMCKTGDRFVWTDEFKFISSLRKSALML